ncbi:MAG: tyrosine--tRNA ligase [Candidatus Pacebacteria bacterium]|nr:tyrosine--tRNA ligase [Candidatus Paceibacterota bacterium]
MIDEILNRGIENVYPNKEAVKSRLEKEKLTFYLGVDPTGPTIHMGHIIPLLKLSKLQKLGHKVYFLIGDFTAMIGDPTDKTATRKKLTREEVLNNAKVYKDQASKFISFEGENPAELKYNSEWLGKMNFGEVLELASQVTVDQMLKRDMFANRMKEGKPIHIHEFMYPLMQGYDSVAMDVDGEIGGNDQTFNMLMGRDLAKNKDKIVIATKLLVDPTGKKMGKTEGNMVSLDQTPEDMFGKVMSWTDEMMPLAYELLTEESVPNIHPKEIKINLAKKIVTLCHDAAAAEKAHQAFEQTFSKGELPEDILTIKTEAGKMLVDIVVENKIVESKSEFRRLVEGNGVEIVGTGKVTDAQIKISEPVEIKIGKRRFLKIVL